MEYCCFGCGKPGLFEFKSKQSPRFGKMRCAKSYRSCPVKAAEGGARLIGKKHSEETKRKIGEKSLGRISPFKGKTAKEDPRILSGDKHPKYGKSVSEEIKQKISKSKAGKALSVEHRKKIQRQTTGSGNPRFGKTHSPEQTAKWKATIDRNQSLVGANNPNWNPNLDRTGMKAYRSAVMRKTKKIVQANNLTNGLVIGRVDGGYEVDHIVPISVCFAEGVSIEQASSLINLQVLPWKDNVSKNNKKYPPDLLFELKTNSLGKL